MHNLKLRIISFLIALLLVPAGIYTKFYGGPFNDWINNSLGGLFYVLFWCLFIFALFPVRAAYIIPLVVFIGTTCIEFSQLIETGLLIRIRQNFLGQALIGSSFNLLDIPYYLAGSLIGFFIISRLKRTFFDTISS